MMNSAAGLLAQGRTVGLDEKRLDPPGAAD